MSRDHLMTPTRDHDVDLLESVVTGVQEQGARYGLSYPRRRALARVLELLLFHIRAGTDAAFLHELEALPSLTGRPSPPRGADGDADLSDATPRLPG